MKTKPNNSDWQERFKYFCNKEQTEILVHPKEVKDFISSELQRERIIAYSQGMTQGYIDGIKSGEKSRVEYAKKVREKTLKEVEGIIGLDEFRVGQVYFFKKQLLSKIKELKKL